MRLMTVATGLVVCSCFGVGGCALGTGNVTSTAVRTFNGGAGMSRLVVVGAVGDVRVTGDPAATGVTAEATLLGRGWTVEEADQALSEIAISFGPSTDAPDALLAQVTHPRPTGGKGYSVDWVFTVPEGWGVDVTADVGDVIVKGISGDADATADVGDVEVETSDGKASARVDVGDVSVSAAGPIEARSDVGDIRVRLLGWHAVEATADVGDVRLLLPAGWQGEIDLESSVGDAACRGDAVIRTDGSTKGDRFRGRIGEGEAKIYVRSDVGDVSVSVETPEGAE